jgi:tRNA A37 methylthiotransferase MiaB
MIGECTNRFGSGDLFEAKDLGGTVYIECAACMSLYAESLSWANANSKRIVTDPLHADNIIVLSCQVTDLAVLNDLRRLEDLHERFKAPDRAFFIAGCLARRFDVPIPEWAHRLDHLRVDYQDLEDMSLVTWAPPFWLPNFDSDKRDDEDGYRFRHDYPVRIGAGCANNCSYCTIRTVRGKAYNLDAERLVDEFVAHDNVVLIADSPKPSQIEQWCKIARNNAKDIAIRNVEPWVAMRCWDSLYWLAKDGLLRALHVPVQSINPTVLRTMNRDPDATMHFVARGQMLREHTKLLTNIIIDENSDDYNYEDTKCVEHLFDSVAWNPMWDGSWDRRRAEVRFAKFFPWTVKSQGGQRAK